jgi:DNA repair protein RadC
MADSITYRIPRQRLSLVRDGSLRSSWKQFANSREAFDFAREQLYADADREQFHVLMLDGKNRLIGVNLVSQGSVSTSVVCPRLCVRTHNRGYVVSAVMFSCIRSTLISADFFSIDAT